MIMYYRKLFKIINGRSVFWQSQQLSCQEGAIIKVKHVTDIFIVKTLKSLSFCFTQSSSGVSSKVLDDYCWVHSTFHIRTEFQVGHLS